MAYKSMKKADLMAAKRQLAMVMDLNKCLGCQTCTIACKTLWTSGQGPDKVKGAEGMDYMYWNNVYTMPGQGYPRGWQEAGGGFKSSRPQKGRLPSRADYGDAWTYNYEEVFYGGKGLQEHLKPVQGDPKWGPNWEEDMGAGEYPNSYFFYLPRICNHCTTPACVEACPRSAIYKREDGIVLIDEKRCHGYRYCIEACPYKKIYWNAVKKISQKCLFCYPRIEKKTANACARQCPGRLRFVGFLDDQNGPIYKLVKKWKVALPLYAEKETGPNVYYVPPLSPPKIAPDGRILDEPRIPLDYLKQLFGPQVETAMKTLNTEMEKKKQGGKSELLDILIVYRFQDAFKLV
ncbi:MAG: respiratory nitrate reductase subunit beta [Candidatus Tectomicrobia bacterium]|uniref:Respiratory nitrate reductase subunit beta n=1 Tax=Tectimicrobiota bacterium TaxID=2528274 RepID=A0A932CQ56_UNCTE|nr:respiratory nitrate reductase subunit beta [Candidatus Tectomicrobia bacterium]